MDPALDILAIKFLVWDENRIKSVVHELGGTIIQRIPAIRWVSVRVSSAEISDLFLKYCNHPDVADVTIPTMTEKKSVDTYNHSYNDTLLDWQQHLKRMNVFHAWKYTKGAGVTVAAIDSGLNLGYPEFAGRYPQRWNCNTDSATIIYIDPYTGDSSTVDVLGDPTAPDAEPHGACVLNTIGGNAGDGLGPAGIAPEASLVSLRVEGYPLDGGPDTAIAAGLTMAADKYGAKVVNCSYGTKPFGNLPTSYAAGEPFMVDAMNHLRTNGGVAFFAAGNEGEAPENGYYVYPGAMAYLYGHEAISVLSTEERDRPANYTAFGPNIKFGGLGHTGPGPWYKIIDVAVRPMLQRCPDGFVSDDLKSRRVGNNYYADFTSFNGTSNGSPTVAGACALILSANPTLTGGQARDIMYSEGDPGEHYEFQRKIPNAKVPNCARGVLRALTTVSGNAGRVWPYAGFYGNGVDVQISGGLVTTHLYGAINVDLDGFSTDPITNVELWADTDLVYSGVPRRWKDGNPLPIAAGRFVGKRMRVVASTATSSSEETYTDVIGHAVSNSPPLTSASLPAGEHSPTSVIALGAASENPPVRISYRWGTGSWQTYTDPFAVQSGTLQFYGVDYFGNIEGGVDYAGG